MTAAPQAARSGALGTRIYNILDFGAKGDGTTLDTQALQAAIDACNKDHGGTVLVPAGVFVIGTVELKSNVTLHISAQGKLLGSADGKQYHAADPIPLRGDSTVGDGNVGLLFAVNAENVTVEGQERLTVKARSFAALPAALHRHPDAAAPRARITCSSTGARISGFAISFWSPARFTRSGSSKATTCGSIAFTYTIV